MQHGRGGGRGRLSICTLLAHACGYSIREMVITEAWLDFPKSKVGAVWYPTRILSISQQKGPEIYDFLKSLSPMLKPALQLGIWIALSGNILNWHTCIQFLISNSWTQPAYVNIKWYIWVALWLGIRLFDWVFELHIVNLPIQPCYSLSLAFLTFLLKIFTYLWYIWKCIPNVCPTTHPFCLSAASAITLPPHSLFIVCNISSSSRLSVVLWLRRLRRSVIMHRPLQRWDGNTFVAATIFIPFCQRFPTYVRQQQTNSTPYTYS